MENQSASGSTKTPPMRILIVDDEPISLEILGSFLKELGYEYEAATDGRDALDKIRRFSPSMVISDVEMPSLLKGCYH